MDNQYKAYTNFKFAEKDIVKITETNNSGIVIEQRLNVKVRNNIPTVKVAYLIENSASGYSVEYSEDKLSYPDEIDFKAQYGVYYNLRDANLGVNDDLVRYYSGLLDEWEAANKKVKGK